MVSDHPLDPDQQALRDRRLQALTDTGRRGGTSLAMPDAPIEVTDATFDETVQKYPLVIVDMWAPWCGPCRVIGPVLEELAQEMQGDVVIAKLNVDHNRVKPMEYGVSGIPTLLAFKDGKLVDRIVGAAPKDQLQARFRAY